MINYLENSDFNSLSDKEIMILIGQDPGDHLLDARKVDYNLSNIQVKGKLFSIIPRPDSIIKTV